MLKTLLYLCVLGFMPTQEVKQGLVWDKYVHDFGDIKEGELVSTQFKFHNYSDSLFQIENVVSSCGCTVPEWPRQIIQPGDSGIVKVSFNSEGKRKKYEKVVAVYSNMGLYELIIKVNVIKP